jgi:hypothetical protein
VLVANVTNWWTFLNSPISGAGATAYPTFQPVTWYVLPNDPMMKLRAASSG